jgi:uncharacterized protein YfeS
VASIEAVWRARAASLSGWEKLGLDWRDFHADARAVLDDPFYWDVVDEFAPHGNDTGADLFDNYRRWVGRNPHANPVDFLSDLVKRWGIADDASDNALRVLDEAAVALAFAELKMKAICTPVIAAGANAALRRQRDQALSAVDWSHREQRLLRLTMLEGKLGT